MYAQCPACLTTFKVTPTQLAAHDGLVRCGICSAIFHAEQRLLQVAPEARPATASATKHEIDSTKNPKRRRAHKQRGVKTKAAASLTVDDTDIPIVTELSKLGKSNSHERPILWASGSLLLLLLLAGQFVFFYSNELGKIPSWRPAITEFCRRTGCQLASLQDIALIELLQTSIAPHPKHENALRIRTTLVNRATYPQIYPWMEVSLTNNAGSVMARRTFTPAQYLETSTVNTLTPNLAITTLLDVTNPDGKAVGYEIRLVTP